MIPDWFVYVILVLAAYRLWRLIAVDDLTDRPRAWITRLGKDGTVSPRYREGLALFLNCPWCAGAWVSLVAYIGYLATLGEWPDSATDVVVGVGVWFSISTLVGLIRNNLDEPEE